MCGSHAVPCEFHDFSERKNRFIGGGAPGIDIKKDFADIDKIADAHLARKSLEATTKAAFVLTHVVQLFAGQCLLGRGVWGCAARGACC